MVLKCCIMTARLCRRSERSFSLLFGMRQRRQLGERRAKATMVSDCRRSRAVIGKNCPEGRFFPTFSRLASVANFGTEYFPLRKYFLRNVNVNLPQNSQLRQTCVSGWWNYFANNSLINFAVGLFSRFVY